MKKQDAWFLVGMHAIIFPFFFSDAVRQFYMEANRYAPILTGFFKFAILSTMGELLALRLRKGVYYEKNFGLVSRMLVWGFLGAWIVMAMKVFGTGVPALCDKIFETGGAISQAMTGGFSGAKLAGAFSISVLLNTSFAPVFMLLHKVTDTHIVEQRGSLSALLKPIPFSRILSELNWKVQWNFVFKKTIPFFWVPAHTLTFLLPGEYQVLFAALLGIVLGIILAVAANKK